MGEDMGFEGGVLRPCAHNAGTDEKKARGQPGRMIDIIPLCRAANPLAAPFVSVVAYLLRAGGGRCSLSQTIHYLCNEKSTGPPNAREAAQIKSLKKLDCPQIKKEHRMPVLSNRTQFLAQASTGRAKDEVRRAKSKNEEPKQQLNEKKFFL
jgi:hypothetical protein